MIDAYKRKKLKALKIDKNDKTLLLKAEHRTESEKKRHILYINSWFKCFSVAWNQLQE
jgi:hypothetical protein